jgi:hypothetical protein
VGFDKTFEQGQGKGNESSIKFLKLKKKRMTGGFTKKGQDD